MILGAAIASATSGCLSHTRSDEDAAASDARIAADASVRDAADDDGGAPGTEYGGPPLDAYEPDVRVEPDAGVDAFDTVSPAYGGPSRFDAGNPGLLYGAPPEF